MVRDVGFRFRRSMPKMVRRLAHLAVAGLILASVPLLRPVYAHDGHSHAKNKNKAETRIERDRRVAAPQPAKDPVAPKTTSGQFLDGKIGGDFDLTDQHGHRRRRADFAGRNVLLFFGYAQCESICSAAIPLMSQVRDQLGAKGETFDLVLITVDPERDNPEGLRAGLAKYDSRLIGLTGTREALEPVWKAFQISTKEVSRDWLDQPVFAHGSFIYLLGPHGEVQTLLPPILAPEKLKSIILTYLP